MSPLEILPMLTTSQRIPEHEYQRSSVCFTSFDDIRLTFHTQVYGEFSKSVTTVAQM